MTDVLQRTAPLHAATLLAQGDYTNGWKQLFRRWESNGYRGQTRSTRPFTCLQAITGRTVAVIREGGFGDMFQFVRYIPLLAQRARGVVLQVHPSEVRLLYANLPSNVVLTLSHASGDLSEVNIPDEVEHVTALLDLPYHFETTLDSIPDELPYLRLPAGMNHRAVRSARKRVGLAWSGAPQWYDSMRSIGLSEFTVFQDVHHVEFVSLQLGDNPHVVGLVRSHVLDDGFDWLDTAAVVTQLDLVISVDTAIAHLAAAMGVPTWLLSRAEPCWRWLCNRPTSPWYPDVMKVFGQTTHGDWSPTLRAVHDELMIWTGHN